MSLATCPHCGEELFLLPDGRVTTPEVVTAVIERYENLRDWQAALADPEDRAFLAQELAAEDLDAAFQLLDGDERDDDL